MRFILHHISVWWAWFASSPALLLSLPLAAPGVRPGGSGHAAAAAQRRTRHVRPLQLLLCRHVIGHLQTFDVDPRVAVHVADVRVAAVPRGQLVAHGLLHDLLQGLLAEPRGFGVDGLGVAGDGVHGAVTVRVVARGRALAQFASTVGREREV